MSDISAHSFHWQAWKDLIRIKGHQHARMWFVWIPVFTSGGGLLGTRTDLRSSTRGLLDCMSVGNNNNMTEDHMLKEMTGLCREPWLPPQSNTNCGLYHPASMADLPLKALMAEWDQVPAAWLQNFLPFLEESGAATAADNAHGFGVRRSAVTYRCNFHRAQRIFTSRHRYFYPPLPPRGKTCVLLMSVNSSWFFFL